MAEEYIETLIRLWQDGRSASQIALEVKRTRNSVMGTIRRYFINHPEAVDRHKRLVKSDIPPNRRMPPITLAPIPPRKMPEGRGE